MDLSFPLPRLRELSQIWPSVSAFVSDTDPEFSALREVITDLRHMRIVNKVSDDVVVSFKILNTGKAQLLIEKYLGLIETLTKSSITFDGRDDGESVVFEMTV